MQEHTHAHTPVWHFAVELFRHQSVVDVLQESSNWKLRERYKERVAGRITDRQTWLALAQTNTYRTHISLLIARGYYLGLVIYNSSITRYSCICIPISKAASAFYTQVGSSPASRSHASFLTWAFYEYDYS